VLSVGAAELAASSLSEEQPVITSALAAKRAANLTDFVIVYLS
jgi:hypothetical protein